ncbi:MAG: hypothetical protein M5U28_18675 [Sandaracinaceae bacterium]|nr:hypothetical protein [Sandaracinaceae bacterium]
MTPTLLSPGSIFAGDFRIEQPLAEGGMGAVYRCVQISTDKPRALKVMHPMLVPDERSRARFVEEARIGSRIESEHVVDVVAAGVDEASGMPWLAMELLEGDTLDARVRRLGPSPRPMRWRCSSSSVMRSSVPTSAGSSIAISSPRTSSTPSRGEGLRRSLEDPRLRNRARGRGGGGAATVTSAIGSPLWMAPEQAQSGAKLRASTDVWALGLISFYALTGHSYWRAARTEHVNLSALLVEVMTHPIEPPSIRARELGATLPAGYDAWFLRAVDRDPDRRFADAARAIESLATVLRGEHRSPVEATLPFPSSGGTMPIPPPTPAPRRGWIAGAAVGAFVLVGAAVGGAFALGALDQDEPDVRGRIAAAPDAGRAEGAVDPTDPPPTPEPIAAPAPIPPDPPTPLAEPLPPGVLFREDWSGGRGAWSGGDHWSVLEGELVNDGRNGRGSFLVAPFEPQTPDYAVEAEILREDRDRDAGFMVALRRSEVGGYRAGPHYGTAWIIAGDPVPSPEVSQRRNFSPGAVWHAYRLEARGDTLALHVDGTRIAVGRNGRFREPGRVGLWAFGAARIRVRNFRVLALGASEPVQPREAVERAPTCYLLEGHYQPRAVGGGPAPGFRISRQRGSQFQIRGDAGDWSGRGSVRGTQGALRLGIHRWNERPNQVHRGLRRHAARPRTRRSARLALRRAP